MNTDHRVAPGTQVNLSALPADGKLFHDDRDRAEREFKALRKEMALWQRRLYAANKHRLLVVFQAMDAGGKDGTIRVVFRGVNPAGVDVTSFKVPTRAELARDFLWRIHQAVPADGRIAVFNRSHYEDVLVVRVDQLVAESVWSTRYDQINAFEKLLADTGTTILKFYLHISRDEQRERFQERVDDPEKQWKFSFDDLEKRKQWDDYMQAYEAVLSRCSTPYAPWYIIPANQNWYRNYAITSILVETMRRLNPQYPPAEGDLDGVMVN